MADLCEELADEVFKLTESSPHGNSVSAPLSPTTPNQSHAVYTTLFSVYTHRVTKRLIDVDDDALDAARAQLGTRTIKDTVNEALRSAARRRGAELADALSVLAEADLDDRSSAWR